MPVGIMQVLNNTSSTIRYHNYESGHKFELKAKTQQYENDGWIPSSDTKNDTLPWYDSNRNDKHIEIKVGTAQLKLSERDAQFYYVYWVDHGDVEKYLGRLTNGARYVVRFDGVQEPDGSRGLSVSIYNYEDKLETTLGYVAASLLHNISANVASVLMAIHF